MKVRIKKATGQFFWYAKEIGQEYNVERYRKKKGEDDFQYRVVGTSCLILQGDSEIVRPKRKRVERKRELRVGDRVRIVGPASGVGIEFPIGSIGVVMSAYNEGLKIKSNGTWWWYKRSCVEHIKLPPTYTAALREKLRDLIEPKDMDRAVKRVERLNKRCGMEAKA